MFPLGSPLLPSMLLPLHVFEPRYRTMFELLTSSEVPRRRPGTVADDFGVVMIERGSEVGGGEVRCRIGCRARIVRHQRSDDGRWFVLAVGLRRIEVTDWLLDDPYPRARVIDRPDLGTDSDIDAGTDATVERDADASAADRLAGLAPRVRALGALAVELGASGSIEIPDLSREPAVLVDQLAVAAPIGSLDRQRLLEARTLDARIGLLEGFVGDQELLLRARLDLGDDEGGPTV